MYTHQPFLFKFNNSIHLLYCQANLVQKRGRLNNVASKIFPEIEDLQTQQHQFHNWTIYYKNNYLATDTEAVRIPTGLEEYDVECSPCLSINEDTCKLTFVAGKCEELGVSDYWLYKSYWSIKNPNNLFEGMPKPIPFRPTRAGFENHLYRATMNKELRRVNLLIIRKNQQITFISPLLVLRLAFIADEPHKILITGSDNNNCLKTYVYSLPEFTYLGELMIEGESVYKSSICGNLSAYTKQIDQHFENRQIFFSSNYSLKSGS